MATRGGMAQVFPYLGIPNPIQKVSHGPISDLNPNQVIIRCSLPGREMGLPAPQEMRKKKKLT